MKDRYVLFIFKKKNGSKDVCIVGLLSWDGKQMLKLCILIDKIFGIMNF